ncbi:CpsD/CapB family tyrosine-protein kinase [Yoonia sp. SS1-5]|uniref:CpsD/CapB family tyrosine-protein kinase n=1 Tax=Yoonia rhodophyticola TaxID=3137370 RepID=A0AAN0MDB7_9RHOB
MDHIRAAIEQARKERMAVKAKANEPEKPEKLDGKRMAEQGNVVLERAWQALPAFTVKPKRLVRNRIMTYEANAEATPFDVARTNLLHEMRSKSWRRVAITSPSSKCGKTTMCLNLAFSLARQLDIRVMVVELDLRRPSIGRLLRVPNSTSFADVLGAKAKVQDSIQRIGPNLAFALANGPVRSPAELLQSVVAGRVMDAIEERYKPDVMIFDMPPMLIADDTMAFIDQVDCALLVAAAEATTMAEITRCKQELDSRTNLMGVVLNKCRYLDGTEAYGSY